MKRPTPSARIAAVCVRGKRCTNLSHNPRRLDLLEKVIDHLNEAAWPEVEAVLLPGGFLRLGRSLADLTFDGRAAVLGRTRIGRSLVRQARRLDKTHPGALLVVGIDGDNHGEGDDQFCAAFSPEGVVGLARKIFPTEADTKNPDRAVTPRLADYSCPGRIVTLTGGRRAALNACYDVFGFHEGPDSASARTRAIRWICDGGRLVGTQHEGFADLRRAALAAWRARWRDAGVDLALAAVHGFEMPGRDGYWQRHGMACAAAALGGAAIGAAHFEDCLPEPEGSPLAAAGVPKAHLEAGPHRRLYADPPLESLVIRKGGRSAALARLFQV
ncbi:MAG: hypothetical protein ACM33T_00405 [Solirubrobacterales bacterium]